MAALPVPSSITDQPTKTPPLPRGVMFIPLGEAAMRSGVPIETIKRWARGEWATIGLSMLAKPAAGGKECWHVREDADPRFSRAKSPDLIEIDWTKIPAKQQLSIRRRREL